MIPLPIIGITALLVVLGVPALVDPVRRAGQRQADARAARDQAAEETRAQQRRQREEYERRWNDEPVLAGLDERVRYSAEVRLSRQQVVQEHRLVQQQRADRVDELRTEQHEGKPVTSAYKVISLGGLLAFIFVVGLAIALDYLIFRGLHPTGTKLLPAGLACIAVLGIAVGSFAMIAPGRHKTVLPSTTTPYLKRVISLAGAVLALGVASYMASIAPNRSEPAGNHAIAVATQILDADETARPAVSKLVITNDKLALSQAKTNLARDEQVDRLSASVLALVEIPLAELAIMGCGLLGLLYAVAQREQAGRALRRAQYDLERADRQFSAMLLHALITHGHGEEVFRQIQLRLGNLAEPAGQVQAQPTLPGSARADNPEGPQPPPAGPGQGAGGADDDAITGIVVPGGRSGAPDGNANGTGDYRPRHGRQQPWTVATPGPTARTAAPASAPVPARTPTVVAELSADEFNELN